MGLQSELFKGDPKLEACAVNDAAHISQKENFVGEHVAKIQTALIRLDPTVKIDPGELSAKTYGPSTAAAVLAFKRARSIINFSYQTQADNIVGKMTIARLDRELKDSQSRLVAKDLAAVDKPMAEGLVRNALNALRDIEKDISILESGASLSLGTPRWAALQTHFHLTFQVTTGTTRALTKADLALIKRNYQAVANVFNNSAFAFDNGPPAVPGSPASANFNQQKLFFSPLYKDFDTPEGKAIGPRSRTAILIHEAIHLTDNLSGPPNHISEFDPLYETMSADSAIHNASSYATFAWHVTRGFDKPRFGLGPARGM
jgi:peptidoglycan hydrolase-like protein with peptidoglycan-binding domain